jgi:hypothetical protein
VKFSRLRAQSGEMLHLDLLRLVASVGIVVHHSIEFLFPVVDRARLLDWTMGLALFVDLFFVISGYVISYVYCDRLGSIGGYLSSFSEGVAGWFRCTGSRWRSRLHCGLRYWQRDSPQTTRHHLNRDASSRRPC